MRAAIAEWAPGRVLSVVVCASLCFGALYVALAPSDAWGQPAEIVGMITEIKPGRGKVEVRAVGSQAWRPAGPLLSVRTGDTLRATEDAVAVILLSGGQGAVRIDAAKSPLVARAASATDGKLAKARALVDGSLRFLTSTGKDAPAAALSVRGATRPPVVLTPRGGPVLPGPLAFEWLGSQFSRYTLRLTSPSGVVLERKGLVGGRFEYPADAPPLLSGVRYVVQVSSAGSSPQEAAFEVVDAARGRAVREALRALEDGLAGAVPPSTLAVLEAGLLADEKLIHDARRVVLQALARDPDEPTLHRVLGELYAAAGLPEQAAESFDEADFILSGGAR